MIAVLTWLVEHPLVLILLAAAPFTVVLVVLATLRGWLREAVDEMAPPDLPRDPPPMRPRVFAGPRPGERIISAAEARELHRMTGID